jgi:hypothetical protein
MTTDAERQANAVERIIERGERDERGERMRKKRSSEWMFADHYPGTLYHTGQMLNLAALRLLVLAVYRPFARPLLRWLTRA